MKLVIRPGGQVRTLYFEAIPLEMLGSTRIVRAGTVEPDVDGDWYADLRMTGGPVLGPFSVRSQALAAEVAWLEAHWLTPKN